MKRELKMFNIYVRTFVILSLLLLLTYCGDNITESTPSIDENEALDVAPTFSEIQSNVFNKSCAFSGCHASGSVNPDLSGNAHANIVSKTSSTGMDYIKPNDPTNSYLLQKIIGSSSISGSRMPQGSSPLSQGTIDSITEWINNGAKNN